MSLQCKHMKIQHVNFTLKYTYTYGCIDMCLHIYDDHYTLHTALNGMEYSTVVH